MSKPKKKMDTKAKREETMRQIVAGEMPGKDVVAAIFWRDFLQLAGVKTINRDL